MGTYIGSPWGFVRGKIGDAVGGVWKGIEWARVRVLPTQRGTLELMRQMKAGTIPAERFSWKQFNIRRLIFGPLGWIGKSNMANLIYPVWESLCAKRKWALTGINAFVQRTAPALWVSLPSQDEEYDAVTNKPDMKEMLVSDGDLEDVAAITSVNYTAATGALIIAWDASVVKNGDATDVALFMVFHEPIIDATWRPNGYLYGSAIPGVFPPITPVRGDATATMDLPTGLSGPMTAYVFFRDSAHQIGYSPSKAMIVTVV